MSIVLVLALGVFSASPELHERLHGAHNGDDSAHRSQGDSSRGAHAPDGDEGCVVTLFAQGLIAGLSFILLAFMGHALLCAGFAPGDRIIPAPSQYLHLPPQAPPLA